MADRNSYNPLFGVVLLASFACAFFLAAGSKTAHVEASTISPRTEPQVRKIINSDSSREQEYLAGVNAVLEHRITYFRDYRTNLCFARFGWSEGGTTNVPCNKDVSRLISER